MANYSDKETLKLQIEFNTLETKCVELQEKLKAAGKAWSLPWDGYHLKKGKDKKIRAFLLTQTTRQNLEQIAEGTGLTEQEVTDALNKFGPDAKRVQFTANGAGAWGVNGQKYQAN